MTTQPNILIKQALHETVKSVNSGSTPTAALEKAAKAFDLNQNYIQRVGEALNVALTHHHFKTASERAADFPIADTKEVIKNVFGSTEKTASEKKSAWFPNSEITGVQPNVNKTLTDPLYKKAYATILGTESATSYPTSYKGLYKQASEYVRKLEKELDLAKTAAVSSANEMNSLCLGLAKHFKKDTGYRTKFAEFESQVFARHGEQVLPYVDLIYKAAGSKEDRGIHDSGYYNFTDCPEVKMFNGLLKSSTAWLESEDKVKTASENLSFEQDYFKGIFNKSFKQKEASIADEVKALVEKYPHDAPLSKEAKMDFDFVDKVMDKFKKTTPTKYPNRKADNLEREFILHELMITDPIISKESKKKVLQAYEQILRLAPQITSEKEVLRAQLRLLLTTEGLDIFSADALTKANMNMVDMKSKLEGKPASEKK